jgi:hypothetical protein
LGIPSLPLILLLMLTWLSISLAFLITRRFNYPTPLDGLIMYSTFLVFWKRYSVAVCL